MQTETNKTSPVLSESKGPKIKNNYFDGLKISQKHLFVFILVSVSYFFEQFDAQNFSFVAPAFAASMKVKTEGLAQINSLYFLGMAFGGLFGGIISDIIGRRKALIMSVFVFSLGSILCGVATTIPMFMLFRTMTGFGIFCMMMVSVTYMAEMSPAESRGKWEGVISGLGFVAIPFVGVLCRMIIPIHPEAWRYVFYLGGLGLISGVLSILYLKESPRWLISKGRIAEAEKVVSDISGVQVDLSDVLNVKSERMKMKQVIVEMFSPLYIKRTVILLLAACVTAICAQIMVQWVPTLIKLIGFSMEDTLTLATIIACGTPLGQFAAAYFSDKGGRKTPIVVFSILASIVAICFLAVGKNFMMMAVLGVLVNVFLIGRSFIIYPYTAEAYPTKIRNSVVGFINFICRLATTASMLIVPVLYSGYGIAGVYGFVAILSFAFAVIMMIFGWRSALSSLEDLNENRG